MTHYDVDYSGMTPQAMHEKCLADCEEYLGAERYRSIIAHLRLMTPRSVDALALMLSMAGIQGAPVRAIHDEAWPYG